MAKMLIVKLILSLLVLFLLVTIVLDRLDRLDKDESREEVVAESNSTSNREQVPDYQQALERARSVEGTLQDSVDDRLEQSGQSD